MLFLWYKNYIKFQNVIHLLKINLIENLVITTNMSLTLVYKLSILNHSNELFLILLYKIAMYKDTGAQAYINNPSASRFPLFVLHNPCHLH